MGKNQKRITWNVLFFGLCGSLPYVAAFVQIQGTTSSRQDGGTIVLKILPANSEGCCFLFFGLHFLSCLFWIDFFWQFVWHCFLHLFNIVFCIFSFSKQFFFAFSHPAWVAGPQADLESPRTPVCEHTSFSFAFSCRFLIWRG